MTRDTKGSESSDNKGRSSLSCDRNTYKKPKHPIHVRISDDTPIYVHINKHQDSIQKRHNMKSKTDRPKSPWIPPPGKTSTRTSYTQNMEPNTCHINSIKTSPGRISPISNQRININTDTRLGTGGEIDSDAPDQYEAPSTAQFEQDLREVEQLAHRAKLALTDQRMDKYYSGGHRPEASNCGQSNKYSYLQGLEQSMARMSDDIHQLSNIVENAYHNENEGVLRCNQKYCEQSNNLDLVTREVRSSETKPRILTNNHQLRLSPEPRIKDQLGEKFDALSEELKQRKNEIEQLREELEQYRSQSSRAASYNESLESTRAHLQREIHQREADQNRLSIQLRNTELKANQERHNARVKLDAFQVEVEQLRQVKEGLKRAVRAQKRRADKLEQKLGQAMNRLSDSDGHRNQHSARVIAHANQHNGGDDGNESTDESKAPASKKRSTSLSSTRAKDRHRSSSSRHPVTSSDSSNSDSNGSYDRRRQSKVRQSKRSRSLNRRSSRGQQRSDVQREQSRDTLRDDKSRSERIRMDQLQEQNSQLKQIADDCQQKLQIADQEMEDLRSKLSLMLNEQAIARQNVGINGVDIAASPIDGGSQTTNQSRKRSQDHHTMRRSSSSVNGRSRLKVDVHEEDQEQLKQRLRETEVRNQALIASLQGVGLVADSEQSAQRPQQVTRNVDPSTRQMDEQRGEDQRHLIDELYSELMQARKQCDAVQYRSDLQLADLRSQLDQADSSNRSLQAYLGLLRRSYVGVFSQSDTPPLEVIEQASAKSILVNSHPPPTTSKTRSSNGGGGDTERSGSNPGNTTVNSGRAVKIVSPK